MEARSPRKVLFFAPFGAWWAHEQLSAVVGKSLQLRGANVLVVGCDRDFEASCYVTMHSNDKAAQCKACQQKGKNLFDTFALPFTTIGQQTQAADRLSADSFVKELSLAQCLTAQFDSQPVGEWVKAALCSFFRARDVTAVPEHTILPVYRDYIRHSILTYLVLGRIIEQYGPDSACMYMGHGMVHTAALAACLKKRVRCLTHERGFIDGSFMFAENKIATHGDESRVIAKAWEDIALKESELKLVREYFEVRRSGYAQNNQSYFEGLQRNAGLIRRRLGIPSDAVVYAAFSSSEYEKNYFEEYRSMRLQMDVLDELIEVFRNRSEHLVIRHHPQLGGGAVGAPDYEFIARIYQQLSVAPKNVHIVMPNEALSTYDLLWEIDSAISFISTVGLEAINTGVPCSLHKIAVYSPAATHVVSEYTKENYSKLLDSLHPQNFSMNVDDLRRLYRFAYTYFFRKSENFKVFELGKDGGAATIRISGPTDLMPGFDQALDRVCEFLVSGKTVMRLPDAADRQITSELEDRFLQNILQETRTEKEKLRSLGLSYKAQGSVPAIAKVWLKNKSRYSAHSIESFIRQRGVFKFRDYSFEDLDKVEEPYCWFVIDGTVVDPSFLLSCSEKIAASDSVNGILVGAWIHNAQGILGGQVFTKRAPIQSVKNLISLAPELASIQSVLPLGLWKTTFLRQVLKQADSEEAVLETLLTSQEVRRIDSPLLLINEITI